MILGIDPKEELTKNPPPDPMRYEDRLAGIRDRLSSVHYALKICEQGTEWAYEEGFRQGFEEGLLITRIQLRQQRLNRPLTPEAKLRRLSIGKLRSLAEQLASETEQPGDSATDDPPFHPLVC